MFRGTGGGFPAAAAFAAAGFFDVPFNGFFVAGGKIRSSLVI
jgi:hypothetical protein